MPTHNYRTFQRQNYGGFIKYDFIKDFVTTPERQPETADQIDLYNLLANELFKNTLL